MQGFPDANHFIERLPADDPFKVIYGVEGYLVDDLQDVAVNEKDSRCTEPCCVRTWRRPGLVRSKIRLLKSAR